MKGGDTIFNSASRQQCLKRNEEKPNQILSVNGPWWILRLTLVNVLTN